MRTAFLSVATLALLQACGGDTSDSEEPRFQACHHSYLEPVVLFATAAEAGTLAPIPVVSVDSVTVNGVSLALRYFEAGASNVTVGTQTIDCTVPCGFSQLEGQYVLQVRATGYKTKTVAFEARYSTFIPGCPSSNTGGTRVSIVLERE